MYLILAHDCFVQWPKFPFHKQEFSSVSQCLQDLASIGSFNVRKVQNFISDSCIMVTTVYNVHLTYSWV